MPGWRESQTAFSPPLDATVFNRDIGGRWIGGEIDEPSVPVGADVNVDAIGVEIQAGDLGDVALLGLVGGPVGMEEFIVEDAVIDEEIVGGAELLSWPGRSAQVLKTVSTSQPTFLRSSASPKVGSPSPTRISSPS